ncbi:MAG: hypothetical protein LQ338_006618 [Usnochroma carphineum]|nr:MAG: hypothetical protein LQ338_006618 [Usnochroma carphineum]
MSLYGFSCYLITLLSFINIISSSPVASPSTSQSSPGSLPTRDVAVAVASPPKRPVCPPDLGPKHGWTRFFKRDCEAAIAQIPRDTRPASPLRNFYLTPSDMDPFMPNVRLPYEIESGDCVVQILLASSFMHVPHEKATWMDIWGPSRLILQQCISPQNTGGIITNIGQTEKLDLAIYSKRSLFAFTRRLRGSRDPVATSIAENEFLQLLGLVPGPSHAVLMEATAGDGNVTANGTETVDGVGGGVLEGGEESNGTATA